MEKDFEKNGINENYGCLFGVGVGPGDPELLTLAAVHAIENADIIAFPGKTKEDSTAYSIPAKVIPGYTEKPAVPIELPMTKNQDELRTIHEKAAAQLEKYLRDEKDVAFLTLGDPSFYSTYAYIDEKVRADGFETEIIPGITSFSAIAAKLQVPIVLGSETVKIQTGLDRNLDTDTENLIILKAGRNAGKIRDQLKTAGFKAAMVCNAGMSNEKVFPAIDDIPEMEGYFSLMLAKKQRVEG